MSCSADLYLERKRIAMPVRPRGRFVHYGIRSHRKPVVPAPQLVGPDSPGAHTGAVSDEQRPALPKENCDCSPT